MVKEKFVEVNESNISQAGFIHSVSWRDSHKGFCSEKFVRKHSPEAQTEYLRREISAGKKVFMLLCDHPVGIVSVQEDLIENLYVLPEEQNKGYGTRLLEFAICRCSAEPKLWILDNNPGAKRLYERNGFLESGRRSQLSENLYEIEMVRSSLFDIRRAEAESHREAYENHKLFTPGSWLEKPVKTVLELLSLFEGYSQFSALDLGSGVGRNSIPIAKAFSHIPCGVDCVDILPVAIDMLQENAAEHGVSASIHGIVSSIDDYSIEPRRYDLILAISALEHVDTRERFRQKLEQIRDGIRPGGIVCLIINSGVREWKKDTGEERQAQFEVNLPTDELESMLKTGFNGWNTIKHTVRHQRYDIPRAYGVSKLETDVVTWVVRRND